MIVLVIFAFIGGIVTVLSPCILPLLPIILSSSTAKGKLHPLGIVTGFTLSFTFFTLFLSAIVQATGIAANALRNFSVIVLILFGLTLVIPKAQSLIEKLFVYFSRFTPHSQNKTGFSGGLIVGTSLGLLWTPCVGPILASVITLAISGEVTGSAFLITLAYSLGTAIPMFGIIMGGRTALQKMPGLIKNSGKIQKAFGLVMIVTAIAIFFSIDRKFQTFVLNTFPQYGTGLTSLEDNEFVQNALKNFQEVESENMIGKPMNELISDTAEYPLAPEIIPGGQWFNSEPLQLNKLRGKVVLVDFWTYSCINCIRTLPYLRDWSEKYANEGLVIIGVHSPEFEFEKSADNLQKAIDDFDLDYPVVQDNDFASWRAYKNRFWPAKYLIDKDGRIRYTHFGEGDYNETEEKIQILLKETGSNIDEQIDNQDYTSDAKTPELYLGLSRMQYFDSAETPVLNQVKNYSLRSSIPKKHHFGYVGDWIISAEYARPMTGASLQLNFEAKNVFLVMRPTKDSAQVIVRIDGQNNNFGSDVKDGIVTIDSDRLYNLVELENPGNHQLYLEFIDGNIEVFAFTFG